MMDITLCLWGNIYEQDTPSAVFKIQTWKTFLFLLLLGLASKQIA